ncbi:MAG TPA: hypothetical protein VJQ82_26545 [Terriglobales bacterium]|nr:hypothetical protein [Terriglobales bacterium]
MTSRSNLLPTILLLIAALPLSFVAAAHPRARQRRGPLAPASPPAMNARAMAPIDLTGYWVSVVTEDWRFRMIVPDKGDYASVPLNPHGREVANTWDATKDETDGNQCRSYGAAAIMRMPGRVHIYWQDDNTLRVDTDSGMQTRLLHFKGAAAAVGEASWQGYSVADWEGLTPAPFFMATPTTGRSAEGYLKAITTDMRPGYLRKNGVPYSGNTVLEEYFDTFRELDGDQWLVVTTIVHDPTYLFQPFITSSHFKKLSSASGWDPTECHADEPR